jgi:transcriptional regulator with XRE-family HTH domain
VTDQSIGGAFRAVRVRRGWRQKELVSRANVSTNVVSLIERGHLARVSVDAFRRVAAALEIRAELRLTLPHGELDRLIQAGHAALHEELARYLGSLPGWLHAPEVSFAIYRERGVIDILAFHEPTGSLLVIESRVTAVGRPGP